MIDGPGLVDPVDDDRLGRALVGADGAEIAIIDAKGDLAAGTGKGGAPFARIQTGSRLAPDIAQNQLSDRTD